MAKKLQHDREVLTKLDDRNYATRLANEHAAELVVVCTLSTVDKGSARGLAQSQGVLRMVAINPTTGQEFVGAEAELTGTGDTADEAARAAARRVARQVSEYAINQTTLWWIRQTGPGSGQEYIVELQNPINILKIGRPFRAAVEHVQGVRRVKTESQSRELIRLRVMFEGGGKDLLLDGIVEKCGEVPALEPLELVLDRGNQLVFSLGGSPAGSSSAPGRVEKVLSVAALPFVNSTEFAQLDSTALACCRRAEAVCVASKKFTVVDRLRLDAVLQEEDLRSIGMLSGQDTMRLGKILPANMLLMGEISGQQQTLRVFVRMVRTDTAEVLHTAEANVPVDQRDRLPDEVEKALAKAIDHERVKDYATSLGLPD